jgi:hypothetical protein
VIQDIVPYPTALCGNAMVGPFDMDGFLQRMATLGRLEIIAATKAEITKYDEMQKRAKGAMRAATREHRQRLAAFLDEVVKRG